MTPDPEDCPRMCSIYDCPEHDDQRQHFEAVAREFGPVAAHLILDPPAAVWDTYQSYDDAAGNYLKYVAPDDDWQHVEALVQAKRELLDHYLAQIHDDPGEWDGTPLAIDALLAAAAEAGAEGDAVRRAAAHPARLVTCPVCEAELEHVDGRRLCDRCGWDEADDLYTAGGTEPGRILAWVDAGEAPGAEARPVRRRLPAPDELPDDPLVLDATATPEKVAALYGADQDDVVIHGEEQHALENLHVTQILDGQYHHATIADAVAEDRATAERFQDQLDRVGTIHDRPLIVGRKDTLDLFDPPDNAETIHFHGARGLNFEDCEAVVVVGAPPPPHPGPETDGATARAGPPRHPSRGAEHSTWRDTPNPPVYRKLRYEDEDGRGHAVATKHYTGLVGALFRVDVDNYSHAVITALLGATGWALTAWIPLIGPIIALVVWVGVIKRRYPGGWVKASIIGGVAWIAAIIILFVVNAVLGLGVGAFGVPGV